MNQNEPKSTEQKRPWRTIILFIIFSISATAWFANVNDIFSLKRIPYGDLLEAIAPSVSFVSFLMGLWSTYDDFIKTISDTQGKLCSEVVRIISFLKGKETDIIKERLKIQVGEAVSEKLLPTGRSSFPMTLVPGGDIALIMDQKKYSEILANLVRVAKKEGWTVKWTTFVPFELLNKGLAYESDNWNKRAKGESFSCTVGGNVRFYDGISEWYGLKEYGQQIIILANPKIDPLHPLHWDSYKKGGVFNLDIIKYLLVRYGIEKEKFIYISENDFYKYSEDVTNKDTNNNNTVRWISLDGIKELESEEIPLKELYNLDFVYFSSPISRFCLVRVDPSNYLEANGGIVGITFIVITHEMLEIYNNLFDKMWKDKAITTFKELTKASL